MLLTIHYEQFMTKPCDVTRPEPRCALVGLGVTEEDVAKQLGVPGSLKGMLDDRTGEGFVQCKFFFIIMQADIKFDPNSADLVDANAGAGESTHKADVPSGAGGC